MRAKKGAASAANNTTLIADGTRVEGDIHFQGSLEVEGEICGNLVAESGAEARVRVLETGRVQGEIRVPVVVVNGNVEGDIHASRQVELAAKAVVNGTVHYKVIEIEKGAEVNGSFIHTEGAESSVKSGPADTEDKGESAKPAIS